jgi:hypothetical protein
LCDAPTLPKLDLATRSSRYGCARSVLEELTKVATPETSAHARCQRPPHGAGVSLDVSSNYSSSNSFRTDSRYRCFSASAGRQLASVTSHLFYSARRISTKTCNIMDTLSGSVKHIMYTITVESRSLTSPGMYKGQRMPPIW